MKKLFLLGLFIYLFLSAGIVFAATPTISALSATYKTYLTPPAPKIIMIAGLMAAYKNFISSAPAPTKIIGVSSVNISDLISAYKNYIAPPAVTLSSIVITTPATKLSYIVGDALDITGLVVTGTYSDTTTKVETIIASDVSGFVSTAPVTGQVLTITTLGKTTTYLIDVVAVAQ